MRCRYPMLPYLTGMMIEDVAMYIVEWAGNHGYHQNVERHDNPTPKCISIEIEAFDLGRYSVICTLWIRDDRVKIIRCSRHTNAGFQLGAEQSAVNVDLSDPDAFEKVEEAIQRFSRASGSILGNA